MANVYIYYVVTVDGAALIAQATAANPIVYVAALSKATAAESDADLSTKPASWYDGKTGGIAAVSAVGNNARIVAVWGNQGSAQPAKSLAVTARLASQTDEEAVVMTAMSDPDSTVILPGADDIEGGVEVPFSIALNASGDVEVTPGAAASIADLARFVSLHKAGDPTDGEAQTILGEKTFDDDARFDGNVTIRGGGALKTDVLQAYSPGAIELGNSLVPDTDGAFDLGSGEYNFQSVYTNRIVGNKTASSLHGMLEIASYDPDADDDVADIVLCGRDGSDDFPYIAFHYSSATLGESASLLFKNGALYCDAATGGPNLGTSDRPWYEAYLSQVGTTAIRIIGSATSITTDSLVPSGNAVYLGLPQLPFANINATAFHGLDFLPSDSTADIGKSNNKFRRLYAAELHGVIPHPTESDEDPPVGSIVMINVMDQHETSISVGDTLQAVSGGREIAFAVWDSSNNKYGNGNYISTTPIFRALSGGESALVGSAYYINTILAIRVQ